VGLIGATTGNPNNPTNPTITGSIAHRPAAISTPAPPIPAPASGPPKHFCQNLVNRPCDDPGRVLSGWYLFYRTRQNQSFVISEQTLRHRMQQRGLLVSTDAGRQMVLIRRTLEGRPRQVLHLKASELAGQIATRTADTRESGQRKAAELRARRRLKADSVWGSALARVAAFPVLALGGRHSQSHLPPLRSRG